MVCRLGKMLAISGVFWLLNGCLRSEIQRTEPQQLNIKSNDLLSVGRLHPAGRSYAGNRAFDRFTATNWIARGNWRTISNPDPLRVGDYQQIVCGFSFPDFDAASGEGLCDGLCSLDIVGNGKFERHTLLAFFDTQSGSIELYLGSRLMLIKKLGANPKTLGAVPVATIENNEQGLLSFVGDFQVAQFKIVADTLLVPTSCWLHPNDNSNHTLVCRSEMKRVFFNADGSLVAAFSDSHALLSVWHVTSGNEACSLYTVRDAEFLRDNVRIAVAQDDGVRVFNTSTGESLLIEGSGVSDIVLLNDQERILFADRYGVYLANIQTGKRLLKHEVEKAYGLRLDVEEKRLAFLVGGKILDNSSHQLHELLLDSGKSQAFGAISYPFALRFFGTDIQVASIITREQTDGSIVTSLHVDSPNTGKPRVHVVLPQPVEKLDFATAGNVVFATSEGSYYRIDWGNPDNVLVEQNSGKPVASERGDRGVQQVSVQSHDDGTLSVIDPSVDSVRILERHFLRPNSTAISADSRFVASVSNDRSLKIWDLHQLSSLAATVAR